MLHLLHTFIFTVILLHPGIQEVFFPSSYHCWGGFRDLPSVVWECVKHRYTVPLPGFATSARIEGGKWALSAMYSVKLDLGPFRSSGVRLFSKWKHHLWELSVGPAECLYSFQESLAPMHSLGLPREISQCLLLPSTSFNNKGFFLCVRLDALEGEEAGWVLLPWHRGCPDLHPVGTQQLLAESTWQIHETWVSHHIYLFSEMIYNKRKFPPQWFWTFHA